MATTDDARTTGHQRLSAYWQAMDTADEQLRAWAAEVAEATGGRADAILAGWQREVLAAAQREQSGDPLVRRQFFARMAERAQAEVAATRAERNRPTAGDYQEQYYREHGRWPSIEEQRQAGY